MATERTFATTARRKDDHLALAGAQARAPHSRNEFDDVEFIHHALAGVDPDQVDLTARVAGASWRLPLYVNGMTGGSDGTIDVNRAIAIAARETGIAMGTGSVSIALDHPEAVPGFAVVREENPDGFVMANLGVGRSADDARRAVDLLSANALQLHLNAVQETVMPEGSRQFSTWQASVEAIVAASPVPVIVKEVGFGLSRATLEQLRDLGVTIADVSGTGGTDFVRVENDRREHGEFDALIGFGQSAVACLLDAPVIGPALLASGGVRSPLDAVKALALGAQAVGVAGSFLAPALDGGAEALVDEIVRWRAGLRGLFGLLGATDVASLTRTDLLVRGRVREYCELRGVDAAALSARRHHDAVSPGAISEEHTTGANE